MTPKTCLIVDDSRIIRKVARRIVEGLGFEVDEAADGAEALAFCGGLIPEVILLDWSMPVMDGMTFLRRLRALPGGMAPWRVEPIGVVGCGVATAIVMWTQALIAWWVVRHDPFYAKFGLHQPGLHPPNRTAIVAQLRLGVPMGAAIMIEVTGFSFMAFLISRQSNDAVAGHQLAANLVSMMFMVPLALANGTATLVAQRVGANDLAEARRLGWHGVEIGVGTAAVLGALVYFAREPVLHIYTDNPTIIAATMPLLVWVWWFHVADAAQTMANFVLRSHRITLMPLVFYVTSLWGIGLLGGYWVTTSDWAPPALQGAQGYWAMSTAGLIAAGVALCGFLAWVHRKEAPNPRAGP